MAAAAQAFDRSALAFTFLPDAQSPLCRRSEWTVLQPNGSAESSSVSSASAVSSVPDWERLPAKPTFKPWTDSYSNLLGILR
jgi:hypothetical protein